MLLERLETYRLVEYSDLLRIEGIEEIDEFDGNEAVYDLTAIGALVIPQLNNYFIVHTEMDPSIAEIYRSLERLGFLSADGNPRGLFPTDEIREIGRCSWPRVAINDREREIFRRFMDLNLTIIRREARKKEISRIIEIKGYCLTETGKAAIRDRTIFIPEKDVFILHGTDDPLFSEPILACKKANGSSCHPNTKNKEIRKDKSSKNGLWLKALKERVEQEPQIIHPAAVKNGAVQIIKIDDGEEKEEPHFSVSVQLTIEADQRATMTIYPQDKSKKPENMKGHTVGHELRLSFIDVLKNLFSDRSVDVVGTGDGCALRVSFDEIANDTAALNNHTKNFDIKEPEIKGFGTFNDVTVRALPIIPRTLTDAEQWAALTLRESIRYYINEARYMELREKVANKWEPVFSYNQILESLPSFNEIRRELEIERTKNPESYWYITAPSLLTIKEGE